MGSLLCLRLMMCQWIDWSRWRFLDSCCFPQPNVIGAVVGNFAGMQSSTLAEFQWLLSLLSILGSAWHHWVAHDKVVEIDTSTVCTSAQIVNTAVMKLHVRDCATCDVMHQLVCLFSFCHLCFLRPPEPPTRQQASSPRATVLKAQNHEITSDSWTQAFLLSDGPPATFDWAENAKKQQQPSHSTLVLLCFWWKHQLLTNKIEQRQIQTGEPPLHCFKVVQLLALLCLLTLQRQAKISHKRHVTLQILSLKKKKNGRTGGHYLWTSHS